MSLNVPGFRVRQARVLRAKLSRELSEGIGWSQSRLSRMENSSLCEITEDDLSALSKELNFPSAFFTYPDADSIELSEILYRAPKSTPKRERQYLADFAAITGEILGWVDGHHRLPGVKLPVHHFGPDTLTSEQISEVARETRLALGIATDAPVPYLTHLMERAGVVGVVRGRGLHPDDTDAWDRDAYSLEKHIGYSTWVGANRDRPILILRSIASWERTRWTLAHEMGHLVMHRGRLHQNAEDEASRFASEFLLPSKQLEQLLPTSLTLGTLLPIKLTWGISLYALLRHLLGTSLIDRARYESLTEQLHVRRNPDTGRTWRKDEPGWDARDPERPALIRTWMDRCLGTVDPNALAYMSGVWPSDIFADLLACQRPGRGAVSASSPKDPVVRLDPDRNSAVVDLNSRRRRLG